MQAKNLSVPPQFPIQYQTYTMKPQVNPYYTVFTCNTLQKHLVRGMSNYKNTR